MRLLLCFLYAFLLQPCSGQFLFGRSKRSGLSQELQDSVILAGSLFDPATGQVLQKRAIVIKQGLIENVTDWEAHSAPNVNVIDLSDSFVLPGLIDAHVHLFLREYKAHHWNDQVTKEPAFERVLRAGKFATETLLSGFTTVRDLGTEGAEDADLALKNTILDGTIPGPRYYIASRAIVSNGGYAPKGYNKLFEGAERADGVEEMRKVVRRQLNFGGADWIKLYGDFQRYQGRCFPLFTQEEIAAAVQEAAEVGASVAVHAQESEAIIRAVRAGAKSIEHGTNATDEALLEMRNHGVPLLPTLTLFETWALNVPNDPGHLKTFENTKKVVQRALELGVSVVCGSDAGGFPHGENVRELELLVSVGMAEREALQAATIRAGQLIQGVENPSIGVIAVGAHADFIAVEGDPLQDISALREVHFVMKGGRVYRHD